MLGALAPRFNAKSRTYADDTSAAVLEAAKQVSGMGICSDARTAPVCSALRPGRGLAGILR